MTKTVYKRKSLFGAYSFKESTSISIKARKHGSKQAWQLELDTENWRLTSQTTDGKQREQMARIFWNLQDHPQWHPSSSKTTLPKHAQAATSWGPSMQMLGLIGDNSIKPLIIAATSFLKAEIRNKLFFERV